MDRSNSRSLFAMPPSQKLCLAFISSVLIASLTSGIWTACSNRFDFSYFYGEAHNLLAGQELLDSHILEWYLPGMRSCIIPIALLPCWSAALLWNLLNLMACGISLWGIYKCIQLHHQADPLEGYSDSHKQEHITRVLGWSFVLNATYYF